VYVVEDDDAMRDAMSMLLREAGIQVREFSTPLDFIACFSPQGPCCVVLDLRMPEMNGNRVQDEILRRGVQVPIVFVTGHGSVPMAVETMRKGAVDFLEKPFDPSRFLEIVLAALDRDASRQELVAARRDAAAAFEALTARERTVLGMVLDGHPNRVIADALTISQKTVEFHRAHIMRKLKVDSAAELVRLCVESQFVPPRP
jgi:FixJ family two-component response regulator